MITWLRNELYLLRRRRRLARRLRAEFGKTRREARADARLVQQLTIEQLGILYRERLEAERLRRLRAITGER